MTEPRRRADSLEGLERDLELLADAELERLSFQAQAVERVRRLVPADACCFAGADPASLVQTDTALFGIEERAGSASEELAIRFSVNEYARSDFAKNRELARSHRPVRVLEQETNGQPGRSRRYRGVLRPLGLEHELRAACVDRFGAWGYLHLFRDPARRGFTADEVQAIERIAPLLAVGLRRTAMLTRPPHDDGGTRLIVLSAQNTLVWQSRAAAGWLADMRGPGWPERVLPDAILNAAAAVRASVRAGVDRSVCVPVLSPAGVWWTVDATMLEVPAAPGAARTADVDCAAATGGACDQVALLVRLASGAALTSIVLRTLGLTAGELRVIDLLLDGLSTGAIAERLFLSPYTIQDRFKAIFAKAGVRSRAELVALLNPALHSRLSLDDIPDHDIF